MFDALTFLKTYNISFTTSGKNCSPGWINTNCCFCRDTNFHLGFDLSTGSANCWKCGKKDIIKLISFLLHCSQQQAKRIYANYQIDKIKGEYLKRKHNYYNNSYKSLVTKLDFPIGCSELQNKHKEFLIKRGFNPEFITKKYKIMGTDRIGDYKFRIIIPIFFNNKMVSFHSRDITEKAKLKHKACKENKEIIHYKHILYNIDNSKKNVAIVVEGIMDNWRLGNDCISTFSISFTKEQVLLIAKSYKKVFILFDKDEDNLSSVVQAEALSSQLHCLGCKNTIIDLTDYGDPDANLTEEDVREMKNELFKERYFL